jgi:hypothetical protein
MSAERDGHEARDARAEQMDEARCLFVFSLLQDGRPVEPDLERAARDYAAIHPEVERALDDWRRQSRALAELAPLTASAGFTERVLAAAARQGALRRPAAAGGGADVAGLDAEPAETLRPFARQLALAAGIALLLSLIVTLARPADLRADAAIARHRHAIDGFRSSPYAADDIAAGLRARLADAEFGARVGSRP